MTLTDSPATGAGTAVGTGSAEPPVAAPPQAQGLARPVMASDAASVGRLFVGTSLLLALATAVIGVLLGLERLGTASSNDLFGGLNSYFQMWTLYRVSFLLLVVMPLLLGVAMAVVPSQVGASNVAFPRAALAAFWSWLVGAVIMVSSVFAGGGWGALDGVTSRETEAMALTLLGTAMVIVSLLLAAVVVATTVISSRAAGMSLLEVPAFAWSMLVASAVWLFTLPAAIANIVLVYADLRGRPAIAYGQAEGADIWLQLDWLVEQPAVYAIAVPVLGIAIDSASRAVGARSSRPEAVAIIVGLFGLLSVGGWSQDYFTAPSDHRDGLLYVAVGLAAVVPVVAALGAVGELVMRGDKSSARLASPGFLGALVGLLLLLGAVLAGALRVIEPFDLLETTATSGVFGAVVLAGLAAGATALWNWTPRLANRVLPDALGKRILVLMLVSGVLLAVPEVLSGFRGTADLPAANMDLSGLDSVFNAVAFAGSVLLALALLAALGVASATIKSAVSDEAVAATGAAA